VTGLENKEYRDKFWILFLLLLYLFPFLCLSFYFFFLFGRITYAVYPNNFFFYLHSTKHSYSFTWTLLLIVASAISCVGVLLFWDEAGFCSGTRFCIYVSHAHTHVLCICIYIYIQFFFLLWRYDPPRVMAFLFLRFLDHTWRTTLDRTPLDEWSARHRDLYLTTHNKLPCPLWDLNPRFQQASGRRITL
jgi:hypothetical protein